MDLQLFATFQGTSDATGPTLWLASSGVCALMRTLMLVLGYCCLTKNWWCHKKVYWTLTPTPELVLQTLSQENVFFWEKILPENRGKQELDLMILEVFCKNLNDSMIQWKVLPGSTGKKALSNGVDPSLGEDNAKILNSVAEHRELFTKYFYSAFRKKKDDSLFLTGRDEIPVCN